MTVNPTPVRRVTAPEICQKFNKGNYWGRAKAGEFTILVMENKHPAQTLAKEPFCTRSQMVSYRDGSNEIARVHQYVKPNGQLGASGKPDPKRLLHNGVLYRLHKKPNSPMQKLGWLVRFWFFKMLYRFVKGV
jgi:hypothetical protein